MPGMQNRSVFQTDSFILSDLDWRCSNDAYADHAGDAVLVSCVGIRIFDGTDFYVCIFILYVGMRFVTMTEKNTAVAVLI